MEVKKMASTILVRVDDDLKAKSDRLFKDLGTDTTSAIMFLTQAVLNNGFPFALKRRGIDSNPYAPLSEAEFLEKLELSRGHAEQGKYRDADAIVADMKEK